MSDSPAKVTVPVCTKDAMKASLTLPWYLNKSEYHPHPGSFQILVNGEAAFGAVHHAIALAKKNISIICWGFQPSMYFVRKGSEMVDVGNKTIVPAQIGKLLEHKAKQGVQVRVLCFAAKPVGRRVNSTGYFVDESQTPGRWILGVKDRPDFETDSQYAYDKRWYSLYDEDQPPLTADEKQVRDRTDQSIPSKNLHFRSRGFGPRTRKAIAEQPYEDNGVSTTSKAFFTAAPSHHQKMVLVDYDDPAGHVGFVMGHNMLDEYWDTNDHHAARSAPNKGRNGTVGPREDFSSLITGPAVGDLFYNFNRAWKDETKQSLTAPSCGFTSYQPRTNQANKPAMLQLLRTQMEYGKQDIKRLYLQAVNNVTSYIYIENQYFRWPPLAEKIKAAAKAQLQCGRTFPVYLFVVTNTSDAGVGAGEENTYRMLDSLGRADTMPGVARLAKADTLGDELAKARSAEYDTVYQQNVFGGSNSASQTLKDATAHRQAVEQQYDNAQRKVKQAKSAHNPDEKDPDIHEVEQPGLKTLICSLVAMDSKPVTGPRTPHNDWTEVYIHAKLMLINDTFLTLGSANINTRSMQVDSELNLMLDRPEITRPLRQELWGRHTHGYAGANPERMDNPKVAYETYKKWRQLMKDNLTAFKTGKPPIAPLREFVRGNPGRANKD